MTPRHLTSLFFFTKMQKLFLFVLLLDFKFMEEVSVMSGLCFLLGAAERKSLDPKVPEDLTAVVYWSLSWSG